MTSPSLQVRWAQVCSTLLVALACLVAGCTLVYDTDVSFEEDDLLVVNNTNNATNNPTNNTNNPTNNDPDPLAGLGMRCGADLERLCDPDRDWPQCAHAQCVDRLGKGAVCVLGSAPQGFCTLPCQGSEECIGEGDLVAELMACQPTEGDEQYCLPGSRSECTSDLDCPGGESCKLVELTPGDPASIGPRCETLSPRGAGAGEPCNDDPRRGAVTRCANNFCLDDVCTALCPADGSAPSPDYCGSSLLACKASSTLDLGGLGACLPVDCATSADCTVLAPDLGAFCSPGLVEQQAGTGLRGGCRIDNPDDNRNIGLGEFCRRPDGEADQTYCASRYCLGVEPDLRCSAICDIDSDCADNQFCAVTPLGDSQGGTTYAKLCRYAVGDQNGCLGALDCTPGQICAPYIFGDVTEDGSQVVDPRLEGHCIRAQSGGVPTGTSCEELPCSVPGACISYADGSYLCSSVCDASSFDDCPFGFVCSSLYYLGADEVTDGIPRALGFCVRLEF